jgi:hypothetical protein
MLSSILLPVLHDRSPGRGLKEGLAPEPCATFPGLHPGIRRLSIYDEGHELTVCIDHLTHTHFAEYDESISKAERERRIVESVLEFLDDLFADRIAVWGQHNLGGGWYNVARGGLLCPPDVPEFVWSGPRPTE